MLTLTQSAVTAVQRFIHSAGKPIAGLRIKVEGGGCSGLQYGMRLEAAVAEDDAVMDFTGVKVLVDPNSVGMLEGVTVDYVDGLDGAGFKFENPNANGCCGCGKSFAC